MLGRSSAGSSCLCSQDAKTASIFKRRMIPIYRSSLQAFVNSQKDYNPSHSPTFINRPLVSGCGELRDVSTKILR